MNQREQSLDSYQGWGQISQIGRNSDESCLVFPLTEQKAYLITNADDSVMTLPLSVQNVKLWIYVDKTGKVEIENANIQSSSSTITMNGKQLNSGEKSIVAEKSAIKIGSIDLVYKRVEAPGLNQLQILFSNLKCSICMRFMENPRTLPCHHVFCQFCITSFLRPPALELSGPNQAEDQQNISSLCPICRRGLPKGENGRPQVVLSDISRLFQEILDGRPMCAMCSNQRWFMHGSDYLFCETCRKVYCPLCALECHRDHILRNKYTLALDAGRQFSNKITQAKQDWVNVVKEADESKANVKKAILWSETLKSQLKKFEQTMDDEIKPTVSAYNKVQMLTTPRMDGKIEFERTETLQNLVTQLNTYQNLLSVLTLSLNAKLSVIYRAQQIDIEEPTGSESQSLAYSLMSASSTQHVKSAFSIH